MGRCLTAGAAILLPIILTIIIVSFLIDLLTTPFLEITTPFISQFELFQDNFFWLNRQTVVTIASKLFILALTVCFILLTGIVGRVFIIAFLLRIGNYIFHRLPWINKIYKVCQDVTVSLFSSSKSFSQVVLVPYPTPGHLAIGFVTQEQIKISHENIKLENLVSVFVPGTPNPTTGFLLIFKREQLSFVNMKVDEAMKFVVSCGTMMPKS